MKNNRFIPCAFIASSLSETEIDRLCKTTTMDIYPFPDTARFNLDYDEALPISVIKHLFRILSIEIPNAQIFAVHDPDLARLQFLELHDQNPTIVLLDNKAKAEEAKNYSRAAMSLIAAQNHLLVYIQNASAVLNDPIVSARLDPNGSALAFISDLNATTNYHQFLLDELKATFLQNLSV